MTRTLLLTTAALLAACATKPMGEVDRKRPDAPLSVPETPQGVADSSLDFGLRLQDAVRARADNPDETTLISPVSLSTAFGLLYIGSGGETQAAIRDVLGFGPETDAFAAQLGGLARAVERDTVDGADRAVIVDVNNAVFLDENLDLTTGYEQRVNAAYDAGLERVPFYRDTKAAVDAVNGWVKDRTRGLIDKVYDYPDLTKTTSDVLVNTIYMKAPWPSEFSVDTGEFRAPTGTRTVPVVTDRDDYPFIDRDGYKAVLLPFSDPELAAVAILPDRDLARVERSLGAAELAALLDDLDAAETTYVDLELPKLSIEGSYKVGKILEEDLGLGIAFDPDRADFRGRLDPALQTRYPIPFMGVVVNNVTHKTRLDLDEIGVEAAAVTAIDSVVTTGLRIRPEPVDFHVDRPFIFMLTHRPTGAPLFLARVTDPGEVD